MGNIIIQALHFFPKYFFVMTSNKKGQPMESKSLAMSSFSKRLSRILSLRSFAEWRTSIMQTSTFEEITLISPILKGRIGVSLLARTFQKILAKLWTKLIGLRSLGSHAPYFLGRSARESRYFSRKPIYQVQGNY